MTYRARQYGAAITEVPIKFVDREAGESKMSSFIVVEALGLVTFWGLGRIRAAARASVRRARSRKKAKGSTGGGPGAAAGLAARAPTAAAGYAAPRTPVRSV